jgi:hypothetical protein
VKSKKPKKLRDFIDLQIEKKNTGKEKKRLCKKKEVNSKCSIVFCECKEERKEKKTDKRETRKI